MRLDWQKTMIVLMVWVISVCMLWAGCKGEEDSPAPAPEIASETPGEKGSPVKADAPELKSYGDREKTDASMKALFTYVNENKTADDINAAVGALTKVSLDTVVAGKVENLDELVASGFGGDATDEGVKAWSRAMATTLEGRVGVPHWAEGKVVVEMIGAVESGEGHGDPDAFLKAAQGNLPVAGAARGYAFWALEAALQSLASAQRHKGGQIDWAFLDRSLGLLIDGDRKAGFLMSGAAGAVCPEARDKVKGKQEAEAMAIIVADCSPAYYGLASKEGMKVISEDNIVPIRLMGMVGQLIKGEALNSTDPMADVLGEVQPRAETLAKAGTMALALPIGAPGVGADDAFRLPEVEGKGPAFTNAPLETLVIDRDTVRTALRPVMRLTDAGVGFVDQEKGYAFPGLVAVEVASLLNPPKAKKGDDALTPRARLAAGIKGMRAAAASLEDGAQGALSQGGEQTASKTLLLALDGKVTADVLREAVPALAESGYARAHLLTGTKDEIPVVLQSVEAAGSSAAQHFTRPVIVYLNERGVEVFPPKGKMAAAPAGTGKASWSGKGSPAGAQPWYLYETIFKVSLPATASPANVATLAQKLGGSAGSGNVIYLEVATGVETERIVQIAAALNATEGTPLADTTAYPGINCSGAPTAGSCPSRVVVLMTGTKIPQSSKLTKEPTEKETAPPPPPPPPKASPQFCNKGDISKVMKGKKGAFKFCYERVKQARPGLGGPMTVKFEIPENGKATNIRMGGSGLKDGGATAPKSDVSKIFGCIRGHIKRVQFQKPDGGVCAVRWPFKFQ